MDRDPSLNRERSSLLTKSYEDREAELQGSADTRGY